MGCGLVTGGCGDDDSGRENSGGAGRSSGNAGSGSGRLSALEAITGACDMMEAMDMTATCEGVDQYTQCTLEWCGLQECLDTACQDYVECVDAAADPCDNSCTQSSECSDCFANQEDCIGTNCLRLVMCGETMSGGACDLLDDCCQAQPDQMRTLCMQAAAGARAAGGDAVCMEAMSAFCM
jgi:hypothetical protein